MYIILAMKSQHRSQPLSLDLRPRVGVYSSENLPFAIIAQSSIMPKVLAEKGGLIFARVRYMYFYMYVILSCLISTPVHPYP